MITNAGAIFVGPWSPVSLGDYCAGSTHVLPTGGCACHSSGLNVRSFLKVVHVINYSRAAFAEVARKVEVFADAEDLPAHGAAVARRFFPSTADNDARGYRESSARRASGPARAGWGGAVRSAAARRRCLPQRQRESVSAERAGDQRDRGGRRRGRRSMNRYPERDALALRADLARYLGHGLTAEQIWAANGSNEVMLHVLLAFAGPGRRVLSFAPTYSMYPEYARDTHSEWCTVPRRDDFTIDPEAAVGGGARSAARRGADHQPEQPDRYRGRSGDDSGDLRCGTRCGRRRRGLLRVRPDRHAERAASCCRTIRGWRSAGRCPRRSPSRAGGWAIWPRRPRSSTRSASSGCPTTCRRSPRPSPGSPWRSAGDARGG